MSIEGPEQISRRLERYLRKGDVDALRDLYESEAVFADYDGTAQGWPAIRAAHQSFLDAGLTLTLIDSLVLEADNIALVHWSWTVQQSDGSSTEGTSAEVLRRQADGSWKFVIDNSDGSALIGLL
jgi:ketosteroid isomerase-like protein